MLKPLVLASESPFRKAQLEQLDFPFETCKPQMDERETEKSFKGLPAQLPEFLAEAKAQSVASQFPEQVIIGSDQVLIFEGQVFHKAQSLQENVERLLLMQGKTHELHTGLCLIYRGEVKKSTTLARMSMRSLSEKQIRTYVELDQPMGVAGGYKIEHRGPHLFEKIETSDHSSIIGLPLLSLVSILASFNISRL